MSRESLPHLGLLVLRVGVGVQMALLHGLGKLRSFSDKSGSFADPLGIGSQLSLTFTVAAEFGCALLLVLGLFTRFAATALGFTMAVAAFLVHSGDPWQRRELALIYLIAAVAIVLLGPGRYSADVRILPRFRR